MYMSIEGRLIPSNDTLQGKLETGDGCNACSQHLLQMGIIIGLPQLRGNAMRKRMTRRGNLVMGAVLKAQGCGDRRVAKYYHYIPEFVRDLEEVLVTHETCRQVRV